MIVIGVLGGVASGKSLVTEQLRQLGAETLDADRVGHEVLRDAEVQKAIRQRWGNGVFAANGEVSRPALAKIVFAPPPDGPAELTHLEQITHPKISARLQHQLAEFSRRGDLPAAVLDAPVMLKAGWQRMCQTIVFVDTPRELRLVRAKQRGWSAEQFAAREAAQESVAEKKQHAHFVIDNSGAPAQTYEQVRELWRLLGLT